MMHRRARGRKHEAGLGWAIAALVPLVVAGCPSRFDPRAEPLQASSPDPAAQRAYQEARRRLDAADFVDARMRFHEFQSQHAGDPLAPGAQLWEARAALSVGDGRAAIPLVEPLAGRADPVGERARLLLGLALAESEGAGDSERARQLLLPFVGQLAAGDDLTEVHAALAEAAAHSGHLAEALAEYQRFLEGARPVERDYIRERAGKLAAALPAGEAMALYEAAPKDGLACALLGPRLADLRRAAGDEPAARLIADESRAARRRLALELPGEAAGTIEQYAIGLALPLSGRNRLTGERALRGALLAAESLPPGAASFDLRVRDTESNPERAAAAMDELAREGVAAVVGSPDRVEALAQAARAEALGLPLLELAPDETRHGGYTFKLIRPNPARSEALAVRAVGLGVTRLGVLYPDSPYGHKMAESFSAAARSRGAKVVAEIAYNEKSTTFITQAKKLAAAKVDGVFVPAPASQLELIASQLAATGLTRTQGARERKGAPAATLFATADGLSVKLLQSAGRYVQGAVFAPVYYADAADAEKAQPLAVGNLAPFVDRFRAAYGEEPAAADALAFDAVRAARVALGKVDPNHGRADLVRLLIAGKDQGVTGPLGFIATGERAGTPQLYVVDGETIRPLK